MPACEVPGAVEQVLPDAFANATSDLHGFQQLNEHQLLVLRVYRLSH